MSRFIHRHEARTLFSYEPSFFEQGFLTGHHEHAETLVADVRGKLAPADHQKLYEAAYFAQGTILEIGRLAAKSTILLAVARRDAGHEHPIYSIELAVKHLPIAQDNLDQFGVLDDVTLVQGRSSIQLARLPAPFDTVFVDGDHGYEGVHADLSALRGRLRLGGVVMFHDYYHPLNETGEFGVRRAVDELASDVGIEFRGRFGGIALFEHTGAVAA